MIPRITRVWRAAPWELARRSLRVKLGLVTLLGMASMALALGTLMFSTANGLFLQQARAELLRRNQGVADNINNLTQRAAESLLLARQDPAFDAYYNAAPGSPERDAARQVIEREVVYLQKLFAIDEICLIGANGAEDVRGVGGTVTALDQLSPDETGNSFFAAALALPDGQVYRSSDPYVSEDSNDWAVAHATPIVLADGRRAGVLHFEIPLAWFAAVLQSSSSDGGYSFLMSRDGHLLVHPRLVDRAQEDAEQDATRARTNEAHESCSSMALKVPPPIMAVNNHFETNFVQALRGSMPLRGSCAMSARSAARNFSLLPRSAGAFRSESSRSG